MRLNKSQREALLRWIAEGLESDEINKRAAKCKAPFQVSRRVVTYYRKSRHVQLDEIRENSESDALRTGLALREKRVELLQQLADKMSADLLERKLLWTEQVKGIGSQDNYERFEYQEFNQAEVAQLRGVLDDIAKEMNERSSKVDLTSGGKVIKVTIKGQDEG